MFAGVCAGLAAYKAIDANSALQGGQEYLPIYKVAPVYPPAAFQRALRGRVKLEYTVTASGQTENIRVIESTDPVFNRASIESAERYRYMPRVIDGEPVEVNGVTTMIVFDLQP